MIDTYDYKSVIDLGLTRDRKPQEKSHVPLQVNTPIVSADNHWSVPQDIFYDAFPPDLRDLAPRIWQKDGAFHVGFNGKTLLPPMGEVVFPTFEMLPGCSSIEDRMRDFDAEGIDKEIAFPNAINALFRHAEFEVRERALRIYNRYLAQLQQQAPGRFYGVGCPIWWDIDKFKDSISEVKALGLKTYMLPNSPGNAVDGREISYESEEMEPFWLAVEDLGLPICFHIGESLSGGRGGIATSVMLNLAGFRKQLSQLIFGGIFDRHPTLRVAFMEAGILWAVSALHDAEITYAGFGQMTDWKIKHPPRHYWHTHCYTTFMSDPLGLKLIDYVGVDRVMWGADYPHLESTFGYGRRAMQDVVDALGPEDGAKVLGKTAIELFDL